MVLKIVLLLSLFQISGWLNVADGLPYISQDGDYYWRDYNGIIPMDAVQAGYFPYDKPIYIGQGYFKNIGLLPATIYPGTTVFTVAAGGKVFSTDRSVKILCSQHPTLFKWISTMSSDIQNVMNKCHLVVGGTETDKDMYIGRTVHENKLQIGRVYTYPPPKLILPTKDINETRYNAYEVLTYNC